MSWKFNDRIAAAVVVAGAMSLVGLVGLIGYQVWGRYVLNDSPTWAESLALLLVLMVSLPVAALGLRENFHLGISFVLDRLSPKLKRYVEYSNTLILCAFGGAMAWYSTDLVIGTWNRQIPLLGLPQGLKYLPLVICGVLIVLFMLERLADLSKARASNEES
ncbi:hypothetical protein A8C75_18910 [Marinobacterium aestuarii]|uniref:TRAP transporter small permease protein n=1 Tax=Marinobacterium aestuarii TaxID=1821621 RepID=A0A1A9F2X6_9GAMM|nr:TRAP transporter small permease [Marinobacterium aestuarii]ANG64340.1 hypothetical protein A8C75_18910 [Marinobacterium aestuarii]